MKQHPVIIGIVLFGIAYAALKMSGAQRGIAIQTAAPVALQTTAVPSTDPKRLQDMQQQLEDWPDLKHYRADNAALSPTPTAGEKRVVFMGDSITDGWGRWDGTGPFFPGKPYLNRGISGQTTPQMLVRFQQDVVQLHPAVVVILAGTNDIAGNTGPSTAQMIEDNLASMAQIAHSNGIRVVLASITPAYVYPWKPTIFPTAEIRAVNLWMSNYCASHDCVYLNYYDTMADAQGAMLPGYSRDGVHPLAKGYAVMGPLAEKAIAQAEGAAP